jgi:hypothetical protein
MTPWCDMTALWVLLGFSALVILSVGVRIGYHGYRHGWLVRPERRCPTCGRRTP